MLRPTLMALAVAGALSAVPATAQTERTEPTPGTAPAGSVGATVNGGAPEKTSATTMVGQTKPPGTAAHGTRPDLDEKSRQLDRKIRTGICSGCQ